ncbi:MAG TPA: dephospho-CoA kinase [Phycisphaerales bacterium]|nr:dephospho-CoA kinase [Phycisphaerales bacterium]
MSKPIVLGIVGGIGSGKSFIARLMGEAGAVVYDADQEVTRLYERPEVLDTIRSWWGDEAVVDGQLDRATVARVIFEDESQRDRLESLLFPLLAEHRAALIRQAERDGVKAVVIDAPLLFEAGLDEECDAVLFVDTPRDIRLRRLKSRSGWDEAELDRREKAQLPLDVKRERSDYVLSGAGTVEEVRDRVLHFLDEIAADQS